MEIQERNFAAMEWLDVVEIASPTFVLMVF
jgi:hypothetical protein